MLRNAKQLLFIAFVQSFVLTNLAVAAPDSGISLLDSYQSYCQAQVEVARCENDLLQHRLDGVQDLYKQGSASWIELERVRLAKQAAEFQEKSLVNFDDFVQQVAKLSGQHSSDNDHMNAMRFFLPGSNRMVGWLEGIHMPQLKPNQLKDAEYEMALRKTILSKRKKDFAATEDTFWNHKQQLNISLASAKLDLAKAKFNYLKTLDLKLKALPKSETTYNRKTIRPENHKDFELAVKQVAVLEANADSNIRRILMHLEKENRRLDSLKELFNDGHASKNEISQVEEQIAILNQALDTAEANQDDLLVTMEALATNSKISPCKDASYGDVAQWPSQVFDSSNQIQYLIEQRRACYIQKAKAATAKASLNLNQSVLKKLIAASKDFEARTKLNANDRFGKLLSEGQQKEIAEYRWKIDALKLDIEAAEDKINVLMLEEDRFLQQVVLMADAPEVADDDSDGAVSLDLGPTWLNSMLAYHPSKNKTDTAKRTVRFGYIESNIFDTLGSKHGLVLLQSAGFPLGRFEADDSLLRPVQLIDYSRRMSYSPSRSYRMRIGSSYGGSIYANQFRYGYSVIANQNLVAPSLYNSPYATNTYRRNQFKSPRHFDRAYPFGILRNDLRRFANPSQPPWYLPGSPNNLRYNQLRTNLISPSGRTGYQILNSRNFTDLSPPYYRGW